MELENLTYQPNDFVSYGSSGVCRIVSCVSRSFDGIHEELYYQLTPVSENHSTYYVPVDRASERLRPLLSREEIYQLIDNINTSETQEWCSDNRERRGIFHSILHGDDYAEMIQMMRSIYQQQQQRRSSGRKLSSADEAVMHAAENKLYQEFSVVLGISQEQVEQFIADRLATANS